jgi:hypothetical protein
MHFVEWKEKGLVENFVNSIYDLQMKDTEMRQGCLKREMCVNFGLKYYMREKKMEGNIRSKVIRS